MAKSNLENLVPALDLCKRIPAGEFADSALIWRDVNGVYQDVFPRDCGDSCDLVKPGAILAPAPTLEEIIVAMAAFINFDALSIKRPSRYSGDNLATAALKRWFEEKGRN